MLHAAARRRAPALVAALFAAGLTGADPATGAAPAELVLRGGPIHTLDGSHPSATAIAVRDGRYVAVGDESAVQRLIGPSTVVVNLAGRTLLPGLIDAHVHAVSGAVAALYDCNFAPAAAPAAIAAILAACAERAEPGAWIQGGRWDSGFFETHDLPVPRQWLDAIAGDRPVLLRDDSGHNAWVNSAALRAAGVTADSADPVGGRFERDASGAPNGIAFEAAAERMFAAAPPRSAQELHAGVLEAQRLSHQLGVIAIKDADATAPEMAAYQEVDRRRELQLYVATCISTLALQSTPDTALDIGMIEGLRAAHRSALVDTNCVKIYLDGVPTPARTAAMLAPYLPDPVGGAVTSGLLHVDPARLAITVTELDRIGFTVKLHAAGDAAVRAGLDAIAVARRANPAGALRHEIAHAGFVAAEDVPRFRALNTVAELSPVIWYPSPIIDAVVSAVGERGRQYWPVRSLLDAGAPLAAGSDWPSVVPTMSPWTGIEALVTRADPDGVRSGTLWAEEAITVAEALQIYTLGGARALRREGETGSITPGKSADFIIVDRDPLRIPAGAISETVVLETWFQGRRVYARP